MDDDIYRKRVSTCRAHHVFGCPVVGEPSSVSFQRREALWSSPTTSNANTMNYYYCDLVPSTLCHACKAVFDPHSVKNDGGEVPHHGLESLATRATNGCHLCLTIYMSIEPVSLAQFRKGCTTSLGFAWISPIARDQARLKFRYVRAPTSGSGPASSSSSQTSLSSGETSGVLIVELMLVKPEHAVEPGVKTIDPRSASTSSPESLQVARQWLDDCAFNHMKCSVAERSHIWKPTHLLDVSIRGPRGVQGVKLVDGVFLDPLSEYVTLSHCWGRGKPVRLTKKTLPALRQGIAASTLPKTFADAAQATEKLGFRYLWIDALCILHDNEQAVLKEISQMSRVYSEATLNLAATSAPDDATGLFYSRNVAALQPCVVQVEGAGIQDGMYKCLRSTIWRDLVDSAPLSKRAWVFQERCLAKRTLHFTRNEVLWECQQMNCSEVFPRGLPANFSDNTSHDEAPPFRKREHHQRSNNWHDLVRMYSHGKLSYSTDKLLAISGLARQYLLRNRLREQDYAAGLWKPQLAHDLLWRIEEGRGPTKYRAPSWSWASLDGIVTYSESLSRAAKDACAEFLDVQVTAKHDVFGPVESGRLKIQGMLIRGLLPRTHDYWGRTPCVIQCGKTQLELESASFDERLPKLSTATSGSLTEQLEVYLLPLLETVDRFEGLLLCATMKKGDFRRLGAFDISRYDQVNWERFRAALKSDPSLQNYEKRLDQQNGYSAANDYTYTINLV